MHLGASLRTYVRASMFVTVCVYICASHAYVCVFARVGMCAYTCASVFVCVCVHVYMSGRVRASVRARVCS